MNRPQPRNPFYLLLLLASLLFVVTALAYALVPFLEDEAVQAGQTPPPSPFRATLRADGWLWILGEVAALVVLGCLSMALDRLRTLQKERAERRIAASPPGPPTD